MRPQLSFDEPEGSPAAARARLSVVATTVYLEHLRASGRSRARLREVWEVLSREIVDFEALPVAPLIARHTAASAELARELGKSVAIVADAGDLRVTKEVFNVLSTAILHGIRNAIDHGVELSAARERAGKPRLPTLRVSLQPRGDLLELEVADDGSGIDFEAVREVAARRGLAPAQWLGVAGPSELAELLFLPGFSTRGVVTEVSGRGVGLDAVRSAARRLGGTAIIESTPGAGTRLKVTVPHRSTSIDVVLFQVPGSEITFAVDAQWCVEGEPSGEAARIDLLELLDIPRSGPTGGGQGLCLRHGGARCIVATTGSHDRASALRLCPTPPDADVEVVKLAGTEAVLLRLECVERIERTARRVPT
jgi:two-component system chemotaxis sensor kinase CheA